MAKKENAHRLFLLLLASQGTQHRAETKTVEHTVKAQSTQQTVDDTAETQTAEQTADNAQNTAEQETDGGDDLEEGLAKESPERVEFLLGVGHVLELALGTVDTLGDGAGELWRAKNVSIERIE